MRVFQLLVFTFLLAGVVAGCAPKKEDPTKLPTYKDMTDPANMPGMSKTPGKP